nr:ribonuclease [[Haemophilus] ducreyi]
MIFYVFNNYQKYQQRGEITPSELAQIEHNLDVPIAKAPRAKPSKNTQAALAINYDSKMRDDKIGQNKTAPVDYYMLALSWSPAFCATQKARYLTDLPDHIDYQCDDQNLGWVIHGLWPQNKKAHSISDHPRYCQGDLPPIDPAILEQYLPEAPGASLLQGEWEKHGACAFQDPTSYFQKQKELFYSLKLPAKNLRKNDLFQWMRKHNPQLKGVYLGASVTELYICYDKKWQPINCPKKGERTAIQALNYVNLKCKYNAQLPVI